MHETHSFLTAITVVLATAAVTTVLFQRLHQPVVLGYILAGLLIGPHVAFPLFADPATIATLSELGVILLMFALGLEFRLLKLVALGPTFGVTALVQCSIMGWLGFAIGRAFGWTTLESLFTGAIIAISSTTIIAKAFDEQNVRGRLREFVVGVLIAEDLIAVLLMATLTAVSNGSGLSLEALAATTGRLVLFLAALLGVGMLIVPRAVRAISRLGRAETTVVATIGLCFGIALLASAFGYSVALGAFIAGSLVAESGEEQRIEHLIQPVRDVFAAIFFVSVGMMIDPALVVEHAGPVAVLTVAVVVGTITSVGLGTFLIGGGTRLSIQAGMSLAQIGEFSFIIAALGQSLGATRPFLYPVVVAVSALTTLATPWLIRASGPFAAWVDRKLPKPLQTFVALYGTWIDRIRSAPRRDTAGASLRRWLAWLLVDVAIAAGAIVATSIALDRFVAPLAARIGTGTAVARALVVLAGLAVILPFAVGVVRSAARISAELAQLAFPGGDAGRFDAAAAPRRALVTSVQLGILLLLGLPLLALVHPFLRGQSTLLGGLVLIAALAFVLWRAASDLEGHVRAGAALVLEVLAAQSHDARAAPQPASLAKVDDVLPGIGAPVPLRIAADSPVVGRTLGECNVRGLTGATVLAIQRGDRGISVPAAGERLCAGDLLAIAGTHEAIEAAVALLSPRGRSSSVDSGTLLER